MAGVVIYQHLGLVVQQEDQRALPTSSGEEAKILVGQWNNSAIAYGTEPSNDDYELL